MSADERRYISHLAETLADSESERELLSKLRLKDQNEGRVLSDIAQLDNDTKVYIFDRCLEILTSDRLLNRQEQRFLKVLGRTCDIGFWARRKKLRARKKISKTRTQLSGKRVALAILSIFVCIGALAVVRSAAEVEILPTEDNTGKEFQVAALDPTEISATSLTNAKDVFSRVQGSIVQVKVFLNNEPYASGSGSIIGKDASGNVYVLTNRHVVRNTTPAMGIEGDEIRFEVQQYSGARFDARLDFYSRKHDLATLAVTGMDERSKPLKVALKETLQVGQSVYAVGSPIGLTHSFTGGVVSALREDYLQTDATVHQGSSGGPLVDNHGAICGIVTKSHNAKDYSFAIYSNAVFEMLKERKQYHPPDQ